MTTAGWEEFQKRVQGEMLKVYTETVVEHAMNPKNLGDIDAADGYARFTGSCGDTMEIWLKVKNDNIANATFLTDGCGTTIASGSMVTELARGKNITEAQRIGTMDVLNALGGLPEESEHCAMLAATALKEALRNYLAFKKEPWKRAYKKG